MVNTSCKLPNEKHDMIPLMHWKILEVGLFQQLVTSPVLMLIINSAKYRRVWRVLHEVLTTF